jgi:hypothetical protein
MTEENKKELAEKAMNEWCRLAFENARTDAEVNDLLQEIAGDKYDDYEELDDPIWTIINRLNTAELFSFLEGCEGIE